MKEEYKIHQRNDSISAYASLDNEYKLYSLWKNLQANRDCKISKLKKVYVLFPKISLQSVSKKIVRKKNATKKLHLLPQEEDHLIHQYRFQFWREVWGEEEL